MRLRRSCLAVPGSNPKMMAKAAASEADHVFFDLEDACAPNEKDAARGLVIEALQTLDFGNTIRCVRVNDVSTSWCYADVIEVVTHAADLIDSLLIPKVEDASQVHFIDHLLSGLERDLGVDRPIALELQIESPRGAVDLRAICQASKRTEAIVFGPGDYAASLGVAQFNIGMIDEHYPGHQWHWVMSEIANHARAIDVHAIDGPYVDFNDEPGYRESARRAKLLGFNGKWCIHPNQIAWANESFSASLEEYIYAKKILRSYDEATQSGLGAISVDGMLVDEASRKLAAATVARYLATTSDPTSSS
jgi:citrate lyase beta subunit